MITSLACVVRLGPYDVGMSLQAQLVDMAGTAVGAALPVTVEVGNGFYLVVVEVPDDGFTGAVAVRDTSGRTVAAQRLCAGELVGVASVTPSMAAVPDLSRRRRFGSLNRREAVTTQPPPQARSFTEPAQQETIRDIYDHLFVESEKATAGPAGPAGADGAAGTVFTDRGDPASVDWDETDLTADGNWHDLNLSSVIPAGATAVLLRVRLEATVKTLSFRENGNSSAVNVATLETGGGAGIMRGDLLVAPDANGVIEYNLSGAATSVSITVGGWWV